MLLAPHEHFVVKSMVARGLWKIDKSSDHARQLCPQMRKRAKLGRIYARVHHNAVSKHPDGSEKPLRESHPANFEIVVAI